MNKSELLAVAKPILFNTPMVQAILDGRKTATRRIVKHDTEAVLRNAEYRFDCSDAEIIALRCKAPYEVGDILYVRETWCKYSELEDDMVTYIEGTERYYYRADGENPTPYNCFLVQRDGYDEYSDYPKWRPSIHMPKEAARIFLRVTDVRVERLQDIITGDYKTPLNINAEGLYESCCRCTHVNGDCKDFIKDDNCRLLNAFTELWNGTIKKANLDRYGWNANPFVWVIEFERLEE